MGGYVYAAGSRRFASNLKATRAKLCGRNEIRENEKMFATWFRRFQDKVGGVNLEQVTGRRDKKRNKCIGQPTSPCYLMEKPKPSDGCRGYLFGKHHKRRTTRIFHSNLPTAPFSFRKCTDAR